MKIIEQAAPLVVVGIELRTSNEEAFNTIPAHWKRFADEQVLQRIPGRIGDDVYAVYTHFEHEGIDNRGRYSLIIGAAVQGLREVPPGLVSAVLPAGRQAVWPVERGRHDPVGAAWQRIWQQQDLDRSFIADHEHYRPDGSIGIHVGLA